jgi:4-amino-4-deoxy-L-arabinose transferase-like glycosyltransferase
MLRFRTRKHLRQQSPPYPNLSSAFRRGPWAIALVLAFGLGLRIWVAWQSAIINPDAAIYIHQAQVLSSGNLKDVTSASMSYLSPYPILLAASFFLTGDWIAAARGVSILVGTLALALLYPLARLFFDRGISLLVVLVYATAPLFVHDGVLATKDSGAWFLVTLGMFLFAKNIGSPSALPFAAAGGVFVLAAWMRIDTLVFPAASILYLWLFEKERRWSKSASFLAPLVFLGAISLVAVLILQQGGSLWARLGEIAPRIELTFNGYRNLREGLRSLQLDPPNGIPAEYFDQIRSIAWLSGLGVVLRNVIEAYHIPFFALFVIGVWSSREVLWQDGRIAYFVLILVLSLGFFYFHIFSCWVLEQRWIGSAIIASFLFIGHGLLVLRSLLESRVRLSRPVALFLMAVGVLVVTLPKTIPQRDSDKRVFVQIGEKMSSVHPTGGNILILAPDSTVRWLSLYANRKLGSTPYPDEFRYSKSLAEMIGSDYGAFLSNLRQNHIRFVVWTERDWPKGAFDLLSSYQPGDLQPEGEWVHSDTGKIVLFRIGDAHQTPSVF